MVMSIVFFDFETGGIPFDKPEIQLAAIAVAPDWSELATFEQKIKFDESKADPEALKINHYSKEAWSDAMAEPGVVAAFSNFLKQHSSVEMTSKAGKPYSVARLAGHNAATFDGPRLKMMFDRAAMFCPAHPQVLCTLQRAMLFSIETGTKFKSLSL